ncbi:hypothetical protein ANCCAN_23493 [Ancylostoma caninum]|uniref:Uncharacterized protein n=1 Tax=Ancylostoma caninum TaxID=29170 RepID=A0A368FIU8_ANCCA|nr:hypothetical protein ANCCAN_23493 [Ancylostoma caninum]
MLNVRLMESANAVLDLKEMASRTVLVRIGAVSSSPSIASTGARSPLATTSPSAITVTPKGEIVSTDEKEVVEMIPGETKHVTTTESSKTTSQHGKDGTDSQVTIEFQSSSTSEQNMPATTANTPTPVHQNESTITTESITESTLIHKSSTTQTGVNDTDTTGTDRVSITPTMVTSTDNPSDTLTSSTPSVGTNQPQDTTHYTYESTEAPWSTPYIIEVTNSLVVLQPSTPGFEEDRSTTDSSVTTVEPTETSDTTYVVTSKVIQSISTQPTPVSSETWVTEKTLSPDSSSMGEASTQNPSSATGTILPSHISTETDSTTVPSAITTEIRLEEGSTLSAINPTVISSFESSNSGTNSLFQTTEAGSTYDYTTDSSPGGTFLSGSSHFPARTTERPSTGVSTSSDGSFPTSTTSEVASDASSTTENSSTPSTWSPSSVTSSLSPKDLVTAVDGDDLLSSTKSERKPHGPSAASTTDMLGESSTQPSATSKEDGIVETTEASKGITVETFERELSTTPQISEKPLLTSSTPAPGESIESTTPSTPRPSTAIEPKTGVESSTSITASNGTLRSSTASAGVIDDTSTSASTTVPESSSGFTSLSQTSATTEESVASRKSTSPFEGLAREPSTASSSRSTQSTHSTLESTETTSPHPEASEPTKAVGSSSSVDTQGTQGTTTPAQEESTRDTGGDITTTESSSEELSHSSSTIQGIITDITDAFFLSSGVTESAQTEESSGFSESSSGETAETTHPSEPATSSPAASGLTTLDTDATSAGVSTSGSTTSPSTSTNPYEASSLLYSTIGRATSASDEFTGEFVTTLSPEESTEMSGTFEADLTSGAGEIMSSTEGSGLTSGPTEEEPTEESTISAMRTGSRVVMSTPSSSAMSTEFTNTEPTSTEISTLATESTEGSGITDDSTTDSSSDGESITTIGVTGSRVESTSTMASTSTDTSEPKAGFKTTKSTEAPEPTSRSTADGTLTDTTVTTSSSMIQPVTSQPYMGTSVDAEEMQWTGSARVTGMKDFRSSTRTTIRPLHSSGGTHSTDEPSFMITKNVDSSGFSRGSTSLQGTLPTSTPTSQNSILVQSTIETIRLGEDISTVSVESILSTGIPQEPVWSTQRPPTESTESSAPPSVSPSEALSSTASTSELPVTSEPFTAPSGTDEITASSAPSDTSVPLHITTTESSVTSPDSEKSTSPLQQGLSITSVEPTTGITESIPFTESTEAVTASLTERKGTLGTISRSPMKPRPSTVSGQTGATSNMVTPGGSLSTAAPSDSITSDDAGVSPGLPASTMTQPQDLTTGGTIDTMATHEVGEVGNTRSTLPLSEHSREPLGTSEVTREPALTHVTATTEGSSTLPSDGGAGRTDETMGGGSTASSPLPEQLHTSAGIPTVANGTEQPKSTADTESEITRTSATRTSDLSTTTFVEGRPVTATSSKEGTHAGSATTSQQEILTQSTVIRVTASTISPEASTDSIEHLTIGEMVTHRPDGSSLTGSISKATTTSHLAATQTTTPTSTASDGFTAGTVVGSTVTATSKLFTLTSSRKVTSETNTTTTLTTNGVTSDDKSATSSTTEGTSSSFSTKSCHLHQTFSFCLFTH